MNYAQLQATWPAFSSRINAFVTELGLDKLKLDCDHTALRVNQLSTAEALAEEFSQHGEIISNNMINGRPILIIKLNTPLQLESGATDCVELPFPSDKHYPQEGWEHIELVLPSSAQTCEQLSQALIAAVPNLADVITGKTAIKVKLSSPQGDNERLANPTIAFKHQGLCVKVHPHSIEAIIASEQEQ